MTSEGTCVGAPNSVPALPDGAESSCCTRRTDAGVVRLTLLGQWSLSGGVWPPPPLVVQRVVTYLALRGPSSREEVAAVMWPEAPQGKAHACLRTALWRIRSVHPRLVRSDAACARLHPDVRVDVDELADDLRCLEAGHCPLPLRTLPRQMLDGELTPGWYDDWILLERERVRQLRLHALEGLAVQLAAQGRFGLAVEAALAAVRIEPLRESAHRVLLAVYLAEGNRSEALRHFDDYRRLLERELGVRPEALFAEVLHEGLPGQRGPARATTLV